MPWTIAVVLLVLWALGLVSSYTIGGFIPILLVGHGTPFSASTHGIPRGETEGILRDPVI